MTLAEVGRLRLAAQRLAPKATGIDIGRLVADLCAIQAQDRPAAEAALQPRSSELTVAGVRAALEEKRSLIRTWAMRGTLHLLAAEDVTWLLPLLGPIFIRKGERRYRELGLHEPVSAKAMKAITRILGGEGPLTRASLAGRLAKQDIPTEGQAIAHLVRRAALEGLICFGPDSDGKATYVLLDDWLAMPLVKMEDQAAKARLAQRYLAAYGPAGPEDYASWSGLGVGEARTAFEMIADQLIEVEFDDLSFYLLKDRAGELDEPDAGGLSVRLLPAYDSYLLGYRDRALILDDMHARRVHPGGGLIRPALLVDGQVAGTWQLRKGRQAVTISVEPFEELSHEAARKLEREVADLGRYLGLDEAAVALEIQPV